MLKEEIPLFRKHIASFRRRLEDDFLLPQSVPLKARFALNLDEVPFAQRLTLSYRPVGEGEIWGQDGVSAYFHLQGTIPTDWELRDVVARLNFGGEALIFSAEGHPLQGLSDGSVYSPSFKREIFPLSQIQKGGRKFEIWVEAVATNLFGSVNDANLARPAKNATDSYAAKVKALRLSVFDRRIWHLMLDFDVLIGLLNHLPENSVRFLRVLRALHAAVTRFADDPANAAESRSVLQSVLKQAANASELTAYAVGHAHIDTAWLWPVSETVRKCGRTFANQVQLLKKYPQYVFGASQPQHYRFVKDRYPTLYEEIRRFVKEGRWELQGGMWVEADCNLISGESMVRQILHGKNFFKDEFGIEVRNLWLPDVFGYSAALPQILRKSGIDYFLTQKLSWNTFNTIPYTTFLWEGIDGSRVLAHFPPESVYDSELSPDFLIRGRDRFKEKDFIDVFISLFGMGDGGGGPKAEYIEYGLRQADLEGTPKVRFATAAEFFNKLETYRDQLNLWRGELFLEMHLGTLTSQAHIKRNNRRLEFELRAAEMLWTCLPLKDYPAETFDSMWKTVLLHQFHDILPGSAIAPVYEQAEREQTAVLQQARLLQNQAARQLWQTDENALVLFNTLPFEWQDVLLLPPEFRNIADANGKTVPTQPTEGGVLAFVTLPALSAVTFRKIAQEVPENHLNGEADELTLENEQIRYTFNDAGQLIEAFDKKEQRSLLSNGQRGNVLKLFVDRPSEWDAWEVDYFYEQQLLQEARLMQYERLENGPVRQALRFEFEIGHSRIRQKVFLTRNSKRLDFDTEADWSETHRLLRVYFETNLRSDTAYFDIQYGYLQRPVHRNTSWDRARYEVPAHKFADLCQADYGVALLNDGKYGYQVYDGTLSLSLLRSPTYPDARCDRGKHHFVYAFLPHCGDLPHSAVTEESWKLNQKPLLFPGLRQQRNSLLPFTITGSGIRLEALKKAEKEQALILRLVEGLGRRAQVRLNFSRTPLKLTECDLMEWQNLQTFSPADHLELTFNPFEIRTFKMYYGE